MISYSSPQIIASSFVLEAYDPPLESTFFPHTVVSPEVELDSSPKKIMVTGVHELSGRLGILCRPAEFNDRGIKSYKVKLEPDEHKAVVDVSNLLPRSVVGLNHE